MAKKVRYAVVALGDISQRAFMPGVSHTHNSEMVALVTGYAYLFSVFPSPFSLTHNTFSSSNSDPEKAKDLCKEYGIKDSYSYEQFGSMLQVCTPLALPLPSLSFCLLIFWSPHLFTCHIISHAIISQRQWMPYTWPHPTSDTQNLQCQHSRLGFTSSWRSPWKSALINVKRLWLRRRSLKPSSWLPTAYTLNLQPSPQLSVLGTEILDKCTCSLQYPITARRDYITAWWNFFDSREMFNQPLKPENHRGQNGEAAGPLFDMGVYPLNAVRNLFGAEPIQVSAFGTKHPGVRFILYIFS